MSFNVVLSRARTQLDDFRGWRNGTDTFTGWVITMSSPLPSDMFYQPDGNLVDAGDPSCYAVRREASLYFPDGTRTVFWCQLCLWGLEASFDTHHHDAHARRDMCTDVGPHLHSDATPNGFANRPPHSVADCRRRLPDHPSHGHSHIDTLRCAYHSRAYVCPNDRCSYHGGP